MKKQYISTLLRMPGGVAALQHGALHMASFGQRSQTSISSVGRWLAIIESSRGGSRCDFKPSILLANNIDFKPATLGLRESFGNIATVANASQVVQTHSPAPDFRRGNGKKLQGHFSAGERARPTGGECISEKNVVFWPKQGLLKNGRRKMTISGIPFISTYKIGSSGYGLNKQKFLKFLLKPCGNPSFGRVWNRPC